MVLNSYGGKTFGDSKGSREQFFGSVKVAGRMAFFRRHDKSAQVEYRKVILTVFTQAFESRQLVVRFLGIGFRFESLQYGRSFDAPHRIVKRIKQFFPN